MNKAKKVINHIRIAESLYSSQLGRTQSLHKQVTHFSHLSNPLSRNVQSMPKSLLQIFSFPKKFKKLDKGLEDLNLELSHETDMFFSSKPKSLLQIFSSPKRSKKLDKGSKDLNVELTHETVMYELKKLSADPKKASRFFKWVVEENGFEPSSSIYSLMLRIYASKKYMKEFWVSIKEMKEKGYCVDEQTYMAILSTFRGLKMENEATTFKDFCDRLLKEDSMGDSVEEVVKEIKIGEWGGEVEKKLGEMDIKVSDNYVLRVLKELRGKEYPLKARRFFKWVEKNLGFKHTTVTYNGILRVLCWDQSIDELWSVLEEMKSLGFELDLDTYIKVSRQLQKNKMFEDAVKLYEHMMDSQYKPSFNECNTLLRTIATQHTPNIDLVYRVVNKFEAAGNPPSKSIYDGIHRSLTNLGMFDEAEEMVETMRKAGYEPDNITYSQLVFGLAKAKRSDEANEVLDMMEEKGCTPDIKTWTVLIKGHIAVDEMDKAILCFTKMIEKGIDPDADLLDVLIDGFTSHQRTMGAYQLLIELVEKTRLRPWQLTYKNLIQKLLGERKFEEAMELLKLMKKHKYSPFAEPFVQYVSKFGTVNDAAEFLKALSGKEYPSLAAYRHVFKSFFDEGRHSEAKDLLFECPHHIRKHPSICSFFGSAT